MICIGGGIAVAGAMRRDVPASDGPGLGAPGDIGLGDIGLKSTVGHMVV